MKKRFAILGTGFWSRFQLAAWKELEGVECVALYNRTAAKAEALAHAFSVPRVYDDPVRMLEREELDFLDVITDVETHSRFVHMAAEYGLPVICQKPMAATLEDAEQMVTVCREVRVPFFIHENWRWQLPIRQLKRVLLEGGIGKPFRARISFCNSFPVFDNQPFLKELERFILADMGSHLLDAARFLFGEAHSLYCQSQRVHADIAGEDVATVMMQMGEGVTVICELSYASRTEQERFPETFILIEGEHGSAELAPDYWVRVTTTEGTWAKRFPPPHYPWADPAYDLVQASIVPCNADILANLRGEKAAETRAEDNVRTVRLVFAAYESVRMGKTLHFG